MKKLALFSMLLVLAACAHHRDVRPGANGIHKVVTRGPDKDAVERDAISQAQNYCETMKLNAAFVDDTGAKYTGDMDESTHKVLRKASKAAQVLGPGMTVLGGRNESNAGQVMTGGGVVGGIMTGGDAYTATMTFKCQ